MCQESWKRLLQLTVRDLSEHGADYLPLVKSTTVTIGILFFLWTWNDLLLPSIMISDVNLRTITVNLYMFKSSTNAQWNLLIAGLVVSMIPIIIIYIVGQKHITSGLTAGAVK